MIRKQFLETSLRAKAKLTSEHRFSIPCDMRFFTRDTGKMAILKHFPEVRFKMAIFPVSRGFFNRGSLISLGQRDLADPL